MNLFVICLNWNDPDDTLECVGSIKALKTSADLNLNIVIVDNASTDDSVSRLKRQKNIHLIENKKNLGYAGGNNVGIKYALSQAADFIWILNPDLRVDKKCLINFLSFLKSHPDAHILSPKIYFYPGFEFYKGNYKKSEQGKVIWSAGGSIDWISVLGKNTGIDEVDQGQYNLAHQIEFATGASLFVKSQVFEKAGLFNELYFLYLEDADFSIRVKKSGFKIWYVPTAHIWHKNAKSSGVGGKLHDYYLSRNRIIFGMDHGNFRTKVALIRESFRLLFWGRPWQKRGILDFYLGRLGQGSFKPTK